MSGYSPESESSAEITGHDLRQAIDNLFSVRNELTNRPGRLEPTQIIITETYKDWDAKDHPTAPIWQRLPLLERPYDPKIDRGLSSVPAFEVERCIFFPDSTNYDIYRAVLPYGEMRKLNVEDDGSVWEEEVFGDIRDLPPEEIAEWYRKLTSPELRSYQRTKRELSIAHKLHELNFHGRNFSRKVGSLLKRN